MSGAVPSVPDSDECGRCGAAIPEDGEGEYRCRYRLEDAARSTFGGTSGKLCFECWDALNAFIEDGGRR
jgi:hypothetical protein